MSRCVSYEFEDVISEVDDVELLAPEEYRSFFLREKTANQVARHLSLAINPGLDRIRLERNYVLFFTVFPFLKDVLSVIRFNGWKQRCRTSMGWVEEVWAGELHK